MIRSSSLAAKLRLGFFMALFCLNGIEQATASTSTPVLGSDINKLVTKIMLKKGLTGSPRLSKSRKFLACASGMSVEPMFGSWKTAKVSCNDEGSWTVMVRTHLRIVAPKAKAVPKKSNADKSMTIVTTKEQGKRSEKAGKRKNQVEMMNILALGRSMSRDDVIMPRDIITIAVPINSASGVFFDPEDIIGRKLKTSVTARKPIQARHLKPKWLIEEDDEVVIQNLTGGISVNMVGLALENGQFGEWIKVQNVSSGIVIVGQIKNKKIIATSPKILP